MSANAEALTGLIPDEIEQKLRALGDEVADLHAAASLLEKLTKTYHARLAFKAPSEIKSESGRDRHAYATDEYEDHIVKMVEARARCDRARARLASFEAWIELKRTTAATERAMMTIR